MIPKHLFFIWFGDEQPKYVDFSINSFKKINPDFKIDLIRYNIKQLENREKVSVYDHNVYNCLDYILSNDSEQKYSSIISKFKKIGRKTIQILSNVVRLDLLNEYGGIYLDNELLNNDSFCCINYYKEYNIDIYFIGKTNKKKYWNFYHNDYTSKILIHDKDYHTEKWKQDKLNFFNCTLKKEDLHYKSYIEHFEDRTWYEYKHKTPLCKYDT